MEELIRATPAEDLIKPTWRSMIPLVKTRYIYDATGLYNFIDRYVDDTAVADRLQVSLTLTESGKSIMVPADRCSIKGTEAFPEVLDEVIWSGTDTTGMVYEKIAVNDGGVLNNIPMPRFIDASKYSNIFVLICNEGMDPGVDGWKISRSFDWLNRAMDRETFAVKSQWDGVPNVCIIQPPPFDSGLLSWSSNHDLIGHAYAYADLMLKAYEAQRTKVQTSGQGAS